MFLWNAENFSQDPKFGLQLLGPPQVLGPLSLGDWAITVRVTVETQPERHWGVPANSGSGFWLPAREGIALPYPRQEVLVRSLEFDGSKPKTGE